MEWNNKEKVLIAVKKHGWNLKYASNKLKDDPEVVLEAIKNDIEAFDYVSDRLKTDEEFLKKICENSNIFKFFYDLKLEMEEIIKKEGYLEEEGLYEEIYQRIEKECIYLLFDGTEVFYKEDADKVKFLGKMFDSEDEFDDFMVERISEIEATFVQIRGKAKYENTIYLTKKEYDDFYDFLVDNNFSKKDIKAEKNRIKEKAPLYYIAKFPNEITEKDWLNFLIDNFSFYKYLPINLKEDKNFILNFLEGFDYLMDRYLYKCTNHKKYEVLETVKANSVFKIIPEKFKDNKEFIKECVKKYGFLYVTLPKDLQDDQSIREIVINNEYYKDYIN